MSEILQTLRDWQSSGDRRLPILQRLVNALYPGLELRISREGLDLAARHDIDQQLRVTIGEYEQRVSPTLDQVEKDLLVILEQVETDNEDQLVRQQLFSSTGVSAADRRAVRLG